MDKLLLKLGMRAIMRAKNPLLFSASLVSLLLVGLLVFLAVSGPGNWQANADEPSRAAAPTASENQMYNAAHILIQFKGATKADSKVTRSKAEAETLAKEVAEKAKAEDANFGALAAKYSDGPSSTSGGDLDNFHYGKMAPEFSAGTAALEIGEISDPVLTPFGYHIILRKELTNNE